MLKIKWRQVSVAYWLGDVVEKNGEVSTSGLLVVSKKHNKFYWNYAGKKFSLIRYSTLDLAFKASEKALQLWKGTQWV